MIPIHETEFRDQNLRGFVVYLWRYKRINGNSQFYSFEYHPALCEFYEIRCDIIAVPLGWNMKTDVGGAILQNIFGDGVDPQAAFGDAESKQNGFYIIENFYD